ncbi:hypothetical protein J3R30DRAFT_3701636 [Lentinula aciculospora]|uniref:Uncharacterized protein n=1 Tax=Lentinula aciculospora TaxID=153920 RepID=A0A9W9AFY9_9AGAR|nr:hypothetical protein J3R30DRAFT_3701636 [Lentinula aciculospora]
MSFTFTATETVQERWARLIREQAERARLRQLKIAAQEAAFEEEMESIAKVKADTLRKLAEEEKERNQQRAQALQELQERWDCAARAVLRRTSDQASREPLGSKPKIFKSASVRKRPVSVIGAAPDPDEDPTPGDDEGDDEDEDDNDNDPPLTPSHNCEACLRCVMQGNTINCIMQPGKPHTQACLHCHQQRQQCSWSGENTARRLRRKKP